MIAEQAAAMWDGTVSAQVSALIQCVAVGEKRLQSISILFF